MTTTKRELEQPLRTFADVRGELEGVLRQHDNWGAIEVNGRGWSVATNLIERDNWRAIVIGNRSR